MKETATIVTLNGYKNYGNRLQLFALAKTIEEMSLATSVYWPRTKIEMLKEFIKIKTPICLKYKKEKKLYDFTKKYIPKRVNEISANYAVFGSDQVWNPDYIKTRPYLVLPIKNVKNFSYAASIGKELLSVNEGQIFEEVISEFSLISVREESAKSVLESIGHSKKTIEVVLDPTLLRDKADYVRLEKKPEVIKENERYVLCYILGDRTYDSYIEDYAEHNNLKVIYFSDKRDSEFGVEEFLYLVHHAELICTDSFHACVFSFIFERPFVAFKRTGKANYMYTRLQNLIDTFELKGREFNGKEITKENLEVDYAVAKKILKKEQAKSLSFLKRALDI